MIGYYAHQHGSGHCRYAHLLANYFKEDITVFSSYDYNFPGHINQIKLADENPDGTTYGSNQVDPPGYLHYSPVGQKSIQKRSLEILQSVTAKNIELLIVDVSAEIAALARSSSIPYAYVKLPGDRSDAGHIQAFQGAVFVLAYYPEEFEDPNTPQWLRDKTVYLGFQTLNALKNLTKSSKGLERISVISGRGGNENLEQSIPLVLNRFKDAGMHIFGEFSNRLEHPNIEYKGFVDDLEKHLAKSDLIVANCGMNTISELLQIQKPLLIIPENRPFKEQEFMALKLVQNGLAFNLEMIHKMNDSEALQFPKGFIELDRKKIEIFKNLVVQNLDALPGIPQKFRELKSIESYEYI